MEEAVAGTSAVAPEIDIDIDIDNIDIDVENLVDDVDPIGAAFDPRTPNTEVPTSITCYPNRSPRDKARSTRAKISVLIECIARAKSPKIH
jgi:hypothetical protein